MLIKLSKIIRIFIHNLGNLLRSYYIIFLRLNGIKIGKKTMISLRALK